MAVVGLDSTIIGLGDVVIRLLSFFHKIWVWAAALWVQCPGSSFMFEVQGLVVALGRPQSSVLSASKQPVISKRNTESKKLWYI